MVKFFDWLYYVESIRTRFIIALKNIKIADVPAKFINYTNSSLVGASNVADHSSSSGLVICNVPLDDSAL